MTEKSMWLPGVGGTKPSVGSNSMRRMAGVRFRVARTMPIRSIAPTIVFAYSAA
jgi:hypothetical protein